jgi:uncharacterized protein
MRYVKVENRTRSAELGNRVGMADTRWLRLRGLLGRPEPEPGEGLLIHPCRAVHMYGMRYGIDVIFLDQEGRVEALYPGLGPGSRSRVHRNARYALEVPTGTIETTDTRKGDVVEWTATT